MSDRAALPRLMPDPWFCGIASARSIAEITRPAFVGDHRPLLPGERMLGSFILPAFQRPPVWTLDQQVRLIESIWSGLPIGSYVWNQTECLSATDGWLLDGQQRITALLSYVAGDFAVFGHRYTDLERFEQRGFGNRPMASIETNIRTEAECRVVYDRLAYGGTPHASKCPDPPPPPR